LRGWLQDGTQADAAALLLGSIGHLLTNDDAIQCFTATAAALRPGGLLVVELPSPEDLFDGAFIVGDAWDAQLGDQDILVSYGQEEDPFDPLSQVRHVCLRAASLLMQQAWCIQQWLDYAGHFGIQVVERSVKISTAPAEGASEDGTELLADTVPQRLYTYQEIDLLARLTGFEIAAVHGGLDMDVPPDSDDSYALVICLRKA